MAYYTGPNELDLAPLRLAVAVQPGILADEELQRMVSQDIRALLSGNPDLKRAIVAAYQQATPWAKKLIEDVVASSQDPELLASAKARTWVR